MPRKRKKTQPDSPASEPIPVAEVLAASPIAQILASREAKAREEPDQPMPANDASEAVAAFLRQREREQAVEEPRSHVEKLGPAHAKPAVEAEALDESQKPQLTHAQRLTGLRPTPSGFVGAEGHYNAGIRLNRSLDKTIVAIQFADDWRPSRDGLNTEKQRLDDRGFSYRPERAQWERKDKEWPAENYQDAKSFVASLVEGRLSGPDAARQR